jgi:RNA polymerase subunit RPABC4/transcription elongation factor Spt4
MKYCYGCGHITPGDPLFCSTCGSTYDVKLCPRLHPNPRHAEVCSRCGSREFSTPQPVVSFGARLVHALERAILTLCVVVLVLAGLVGFLSTEQGQNAFLVSAVLAALLWWLWSQLPEWLRKRVRRRKKDKRSGHEK